MSLSKRLKEEMPIDRAVAECGDCGVELFDSMKSERMSPLVAGSNIILQAESHKDKTGHDDLQVNLQKTEPVKSIDATITVSDE